MVDGLGHGSASRQWVRWRSRAAELVATSQAIDCRWWRGLSTNGWGGSGSGITSSRLLRATRRWLRAGDWRSTTSDTGDRPSGGRGQVFGGWCGSGVAGGRLAVDGLWPRLGVTSDRRGGGWGGNDNDVGKAAATAKRFANWGRGGDSER
jgi:hypothetical protein